MTCSASLLLLFLSMFPPIQEIEWARREVRSLGFGVEMPRPWIYEIAGKTRLVGRERPGARKVPAELSVRSDRASMSLDFTSKSYRDNDLPLAFPGCRVTKEERLDLAGVPAHFFHLTDLGSGRAGTDLFETIVRSEGRHVFISLFFESGRNEDYEDIYRHVLESLWVSEKPTVSEQIASKRAAQKQIPEGKIAWTSSFQSALLEAQERNVPLFIALNMDNEAANDQILKSHYEDPEIVSISRKMVCVIGSIFDHGGRQGKGGYCPRFGNLYCEEHRSSEMAVRERYLRSPTAVAPQHMMCSPDGTLLSRREYMLPTLDLLRMMEGAIQVVESQAKYKDFGSADGLLSLYRKAEGQKERREIVSDVLYLGDEELARGFFEKVGEDLGPEELSEVIDNLAYSRHPDGSLYAASFLGHELEKIRNGSARAIEILGDARVTEQVQARLKKERSLDVKKELLRALGSAGREDKKIADLILKYTRSGPVKLRVHAVLALRHFPGNKKVMQAILKSFRTGRGDELKGAAALILGLHKVQGAAPILEKAARAEGVGELEGEMARWALECIRGDLDPQAGFRELAKKLM